MSGEESVEEIARAAVALCADLLRRYEPVGSVGLMVRTPMTTRERVEEWGRQVLAWQDQLDGTQPDPPDCPAQQTGEATDCICTDAGACGELHARRTMDARRARRA